MRILVMSAVALLWSARGLPADDLGPTTPATPELARAAYARFQTLEGEWEGHSTKGWVESLHYQSIAAGSTVLETSLDAHPGEAMATTFYLDGDRLLLTHYCGRVEVRAISRT